MADTKQTQTGKRVLIVDDSKTIQKVVSAAVTSLGGNVVGTSSDGEDGVQKYKALKPDLVLLDVTMPNKDGRQCLKEIMEFDPRACVVMLSALNSEDVIKECLQIGAKAFIDKPSVSHNDALKRALERYLSRKAT